MIVVLLAATLAVPAEAQGGTDSQAPSAGATVSGNRIEVTISVGGDTRVTIGSNPLADCIIVANLLGSSAIDYAGGLGINLGVTNPGMESAVDEDGNPKAYVFISCPTNVFDGFRWAVWEQGGDVPPEVLTALGNAAVQSIALDVPTPQTAPDGLDVPFVIQLPVWLWVPEATWVPATARAELPTLGLWAEATATPTVTNWETGARDNPEINCDQGTPWQPGLDDSETDCFAIYGDVTEPGTTIPLTLATTYSVAVSCNGGACPAGVDVDPITLVTSRPITVTEIRGLITR